VSWSPGLIILTPATPVMVMVALPVMFAMEKGNTTVMIAKVKEKKNVRRAMVPAE